MFATCYPAHCHDGAIYWTTRDKSDVLWKRGHNPVKIKMSDARYTLISFKSWETVCPKMTFASHVQYFNLSFGIDLQQAWNIECWTWEASENNIKVGHIFKILFCIHSDFFFTGYKFLETIRLWSIFRHLPVFLLSRTYWA